MPPVGFEPTVSAGERPKNYASDRAATGIGGVNYVPLIIPSPICVTEETKNFTRTHNLNFIQKYIGIFHRKLCAFVSVCVCVLMC